MRIGRLPGMEKALREEMRRRERRAFLRRAAWLAASYGSGLWMGARWLGSAPVDQGLRDLDEARRLARAPLQALLHRYVEVLDAIDLHGGDPELWRGVRRLGRWALADPLGAERGRVACQVELTLAARTGLPADVRRLLEDLRARPRHEGRGERGGGGK